MSLIESILRGGPLIVIVWVCILATATVIAALVVRLFWIVRSSRLAPPAVIELLQTAIDAGNYQEAWEICHANKSYVTVVLESALERLGDGREAFETASAEKAEREAAALRTRVNHLCIVASVAPLIGLLGTVVMIGATATLGPIGSDPRAQALQGLTATAGGVCVALPAFLFYWLFRTRAATALTRADEKLSHLVKDIPCEELEGLRVGEEFSAGGGLGALGAGASRKVSMALTSDCPVCHRPISPGESPCSHCGAILEWT
jgi:biopolymer transport protein ExbB